MVKVFHRVKLAVLDGISASLVQRVTAGNVSLHFLVSVVAHGHLGSGKVGNTLTFRRNQAQAGKHSVGFATQGAKNAGSIILIGGFADDLALEYYGGIGSQDPGIWRKLSFRSSGFGFSQAGNIGRRLF